MDGYDSKTFVIVCAFCQRRERPQLTRPDPNPIVVAGNFISGAGRVLLSCVSVFLHQENCFAIKPIANLPSWVRLSLLWNPNGHALFDVCPGILSGKERINPDVIAGGFDGETAASWLQQGRADLIALGRKFLANPDLPERLCQHARPNADDPATYYGGGAGGYIDYPTLAQERGEEPTIQIDERWR